MKAIFEYDNGKKYHINIDELNCCNNDLVQYSTKGTKWENGYRMDYTHTIDVVRSGLVSVTFIERQDSVKRETKYVFKQPPRKKDKEEVKEIQAIKEGVIYKSVNSYLTYRWKKTEGIVYVNRGYCWEKSDATLDDFLTDIKEGHLIPVKGE